MSFWNSVMKIAEAGVGLPNHSELKRHHNYIRNGIQQIQNSNLLKSKQNNLTDYINEYNKQYLD